MKRLFTLLLALLLCALCACTTPSADGGVTGQPAVQQTPSQNGEDTSAPEAPDTTAEPVEVVDKGPGDDYKSAFAFYESGLIPALTARLKKDHSAANEALEQREPGFAEEDASYNEPITLRVPDEMTLTRDFSDGMDEAFILENYGEFGYENVEYTLAAPGSYVVTYSDELETGFVYEYEDHCEFADGSVRFWQETNGVVNEYREFLCLGGGTYALQSLTERAFVTYIDGQILDYAYSETVYERGLDNDPIEASWIHAFETDSIWGREDVTKAWVTESADGSPFHRALIQNENGELTYYGCKQLGFGSEAVFEPFEPITIRTN